MITVLLDIAVDVGGVVIISSVDAEKDDRWTSRGGLWASLVPGVGNGFQVCSVFPSTAKTHRSNSPWFNDSTCQASKSIVWHSRASCWRQWILFSRNMPLGYHCLGRRKLLWIFFSRKLGTSGCSVYPEKSACNSRVSFFWENACVLSDVPAGVSIIFFFPRLLEILGRERPWSTFRRLHWKYVASWNFVRYRTRLHVLGSMS